MRLTVPFILAALSHFSAFGALAEVPAPCLESDIRDLCPASCAAACGEAAFMAENATYCLSNGHFVDDPNANAPGDSRACVEHFGTAIIVGRPPLPIPGGSSGEAAPTNTEAGQPEVPDCSALPTWSEQRRCELAKVTPACSANLTELEGQARLLVTAIDLELGHYGELLTREWTDLNNRALLCAFSLAELDRNYEIATRNPTILRILQRAATDIQACQTEWEQWVRDASGSEGSDSLIDSVTRDAEWQFEALRVQMENLRTSVARLQSAADTIVEIVDIHLIYCDPAGTPPPTQ